MITRSPSISGSIQFSVVLLAMLLRLFVSGDPIAGQEHRDISGTSAIATVAHAGVFLEHIRPSESSVQPFGASPSAPPKVQFNEVPAIIGQCDRAVRVAAGRSQLTARSVLRSLRRCELLFPFHFFW